MCAPPGHPDPSPARGVQSHRALQPRTRERSGRLFTVEGQCAYAFLVRSENRSHTIDEVAETLGLGRRNVEALIDRGRLTLLSDGRVDDDSVSTFQAERQAEHDERKRKVAERAAIASTAAPGPEPSSTVPPRQKARPNNSSKVPSRRSAKPISQAATPRKARPAKETMTATARPAAEPRPATVARPGIFLVHGRDEAMESKVARIVERCVYADVKILHEQVWRGQTIIEKFEEAGELTNYAIVIATGDDEGRLIGDQELLPRPRQNVVLELGYFVGKLGRDRVALLKGTGVDLPSDLLGVGYVALDPAGGWQLQLLRELRAAGFTVDLNRLH